MNIWVLFPPQEVVYYIFMAINEGGQIITLQSSGVLTAAIESQSCRFDRLSGSEDDW